MVTPKKQKTFFFLNVYALFQANFIVLVCFHSKFNSGDEYQLACIHDFLCVLQAQNMVIFPNMDYVVYMQQ